MACEILERAGIEPYLLTSFFRRLKVVAEQEFISKFEIIASHPNFDRRIRKVFSYETGSDFIPASERSDIDDLKKMIRDCVW